MRAKLEAPPAPPAAPTALVPNLQIVPPYQLTFLCLPHEVANYGATRCLRFAYGVHNVGAGPLDMLFPPVDGLLGEGPVAQRIHHSDGSFEDHPGGTFTYHPAHAHYHHSAIGAGDLYHVVDPQTGVLAKVGESPKVGYCMGEVLIAEWERFGSEPPTDFADILARGCGAGAAVVPGAGARIRVAAGWGDIYAQSTEGNYVEFGSNPDGEYVIRMDADLTDTLMETDEHDNVGYAHVRVAENGNKVFLIERGRGLSPWDPNKVLVHDTRE